MSVLAIDPLMPTTLYAVTQGGANGVWKSINGGGSWSPVLGPSNWYALAIDPQTPATLYAGANFGGVFKSTNGGVTWSSTHVTDGSVLSLAIDPQTPATLYAGTDGGSVLVYTADRTPPVTTLTLAGPAGSNGWYRDAVVATSSASDPDNAPAQLTTFCVIDGGSAQTYSAPFTPSGDGVHHISYWSIDPDGNEEAHHLIEVKIDSTPPSVTVSATPSSLWPPNGTMVPVTVSGTMTDSGSGIDPASARFAVNDSYGRVQPSGNVSVGPDGSYAFTVSLEASRDGNDKSGRTYTLSISAGDLAGNTGLGSAIVTVPHNQGK